MLHHEAKSIMILLQSVNNYWQLIRRNIPEDLICMNSLCILTPWCRVLLEKLSCLQLVKKFPAFHGTRRFITALTSVRHLSLSWASPIQSIYPHPTSWRYILILSTHLRLGLPSGLLSGFPTKTLYTPFSSPIRTTCPAHLLRYFNERKTQTTMRGDLRGDGRDSALLEFEFPIRSVLF